MSVGVYVIYEWVGGCVGGWVSVEWLVSVESLGMEGWV